MEHLTFKEHLTLFEGRKKGLTYTETQVKNAVDKVTVSLKGSDSANMTKLARRFARLDASLKALKEQHDALNARLKGDVQDLFEAEDVVLTRVVETAQFTLMLSKEIQKTEGSVEVDYKSIIAALTVLVPDELQSKVESITEKYTKTIPPKPPVRRLIVSKDLVKEGLLDNIKKVAASFLKSIMSWATRYDSKLAALKKQSKIKSLTEIKDFLSKASRGKYMTASAFMISLSANQYKEMFDWMHSPKAPAGKVSLNDLVTAWAEIHAPDIEIIDDDTSDGVKDDGKNFKIVDDDDDD